MDNVEELKAAKNVIHMILKAKKNLRMYPSNNPIYRKTLEEAFEIFQGFFQFNEKLIFHIRLYEIFYGDTSIYQNDRQSNDNLSFFLFKDGLRELSFKKKLSSEELESFLKILSLDFDNEVLDDDVITLFWESDFLNIRYVVEDDFLADEDYEEKAVSQAVMEKNDSGQFKAIYENSLTSHDKISSTEIIPIDDTDTQALFHEIEKDAGDKLDKFIHILFEILYKTRTEDGFIEIVDFFKSTIEYAIKNGNFDAVMGALKRLDKIAAKPKNSDVVKRNIRKIIAFVANEHIIYLIGEYLDTMDKSAPEPLKEMLRYFDKRAIPPFMNLLSTLNTIHARKVVLDVLIHLCPMDFLTVTKGLNSPEWYVVRNIIYILREVGDPRAVDYLLKKLGHEDVRVRIEAVRSLGELGGEQALPAIVACLSEDTEAQLRFTAIRALGSLGDGNAKKILLENISAKSFDSKHYNEKKEYFQILSRWKDPDTIDFISKILMKRTLIPSEKFYEKKSCAAYGLGLIGDQNVLPLLYKYRASKNKLLKEVSDSAIQRIEHEIQKQN